MLNRYQNELTALVLTAVLPISTPAFASDDTKDLSKVSCKEVMILSGEDRDISIAFVHGYMLGKNKTTQYDVGKLSAITDAFLDYCLDHPSEKALASFEKVYK